MRNEVSRLGGLGTRRWIVKLSLAFDVPALQEIPFELGMINWGDWEMGSCIFVGICEN